jgi:hypothetical protein
MKYLLFVATILGMILLPRAKGAQMKAESHQPKGAQAIHSRN